MAVQTVAINLVQWVYWAFYNRDGPMRVSERPVIDRLAEIRAESRLFNGTFFPQSNPAPNAGQAPLL